MFQDAMHILNTVEWSTWITAFSTLCLTILTAVYVSYTKLLVSLQGHPCVIVTVVHDMSRPTILEIVIRNIGRGLATDITFELSREIPRKAFNQDKEVEKMDHGPLINGIPSLGPDEIRRITWGQFIGLKKHLGEEPIEVISRFKHREKYLPPVISQLEVCSFEGTEASGTELYNIKRELENINRTLGKIKC